MRLKPGAKIFFALVILALIITGLYKMGMLDSVVKTIAPDRKPAGTLSKGDFDFGETQSTTPAGAGSPVVPGKPLNLTRPMRVGIVQYGGFAGGILANGGLAVNPQSTYSKYGVDVEFVQIDDLVAMADAFRAGGDNGGLDMMATTVDMFALQYASLKDVKPVTILQTDWSRGADAIAVGPGISKVEDLKGKTIALAQETPSHFLLLYILTQAGLTNNDFKPVWTNSAIEAADIFGAGKANACVSWSPFVYFAADAVPGSSILTSTGDATNLLAGTMVARGDFAAAYPDAVTAFLQGWFDGVDAANTDMEAAAGALLTSFQGITQDDAMGMLYDVKLAGAVENRQFFGLEGGGVMSYDDLWFAANQIWVKIGALKESTRPDLSRNTSFLNDATARVAGSVPSAAQEFEFSEPTEETEAKQPIVTKRVSIYFATGSAALDSNAQVVLESAAELAQTFGSAYIRVSGNTDSTGGRQMNIDLSKRRAQSVVDFMVKQFDFPRDKFIVEGNGPDKPVASNDTDEGRAQNRRTDFEVLAQQ